MPMICPHCGCLLGAHEFFTWEHDTGPIPSRICPPVADRHYDWPYPHPGRDEHIPWSLWRDMTAGKPT